MKQTILLSGLCAALLCGCADVRISEYKRPEAPDEVLLVPAFGARRVRSRHDFNAVVDGVPGPLPGLARSQGDFG